MFGCNINMSNLSNHSNKKRKDSLEDSLYQVLFAAELEFWKILVPKLPQHTSKHLYSLYEQLLGALIYLNLIILFLIYDAWCKLYNIWLLLCEKNSRSITIQELNTGRKILLQLLLKIE